MDLDSIDELLQAYARNVAYEMGENMTTSTSRNVRRLNRRRVGELRNVLIKVLPS